jgi:hypothetical protein
VSLRLEFKVFEKKPKQQEVKRKTFSSAGERSHFNEEFIQSAAAQKYPQPTKPSKQKKENEKMYI